MRLTDDSKASLFLPLPYVLLNRPLLIGLHSSIPIPRHLWPYYTVSLVDILGGHKGIKGGGQKKCTEEEKRTIPTFTDRKRGAIWNGRCVFRRYGIRAMFYQQSAKKMVTACQRTGAT